MTAPAEARIREIVREEIAAEHCEAFGEQIATPCTPIGKPFSPSVISAALRGQSDE